jgi:prepilin-type N-terminal cleavage/methylation domain-containing protein
MSNMHRTLGAATGRRSRSGPRRPVRARAGFTVVEIIVAMVVLSIGVLGLAATAAVVQRQMASGERQSAAAAIAQSRFDQLTSVNCQTLGTQPTTKSWRKGHVTETWVVTPIQNNVRQITETITITGYKAPLVYTTYIPCRI